ncbi:MAG: hypothetical protein C4532_10000 [Candidatus Abyssobacteria bacterium SURF_17]|uniref:Uncharacterized protein n=1 Tax=Candidatus Abyssobacteria bacterium SURF_17 TaxID=2093361 RepID=A0A419EY20_9BACT|nr:MAG: hypothetical protein C4532_10000 [Candidatus Abyssubacteria bacterium SURF_17]
MPSGAHTITKWHLVIATPPVPGEAIGQEDGDCFVALFLLRNRIPAVIARERRAAARSDRSNLIGQY